MLAKQGVKCIIYNELAAGSGNVVFDNAYIFIERGIGPGGYIALQGAHEVFCIIDQYAPIQVCIAVSGIKTYPE
jgi:hypothetical protein